MSTERYMALKWTCRGYDKMMCTLEDMREPLRGKPRGEKTGGGCLGDSTAETAGRVLQSKEYQITSAIKQAAIEVDAELYLSIIDNVCRGRSFAQVRPKPWCGERQFYRRCVLFFVRLDRLL